MSKIPVDELRQKDVAVMRINEDQKSDKNNRLDLNVGKIMDNLDDYEW